jgi:hypothetical protein
MGPFLWSHEKSAQVLTNRGLCFEAVVAAIEAGDLLDVLEHPNPDRYPGQRIFVVAAGGGAGGVSTNENGWANTSGLSPLDLTLHAQRKLETYGITGERLVDGQTGSILFRHPELRGIPDLVVEGDGYTMEFIGSKLLCLDIQDPSGMVRLLAEPLKDQLPVGV